MRGELEKAQFVLDGDVQNEAEYVIERDVVYISENVREVVIIANGRWACPLWVKRESISSIM